MEGAGRPEFGGTCVGGCVCAGAGCVAGGACGGATDAAAAYSWVWETVCVPPV